MNVLCRIAEKDKLFYFREIHSHRSTSFRLVRKNRILTFSVVSFFCTFLKKKNSEPYNHPSL